MVGQYVTEQVLTILALLIELQASLHIYRLRTLLISIDFEINPY